MPDPISRKLIVALAGFTVRRVRGQLGRLNTLLNTLPD